MTLLKPGEEAPDFEAPTQDGKPVRLRDLRGRWVVLFFYPKDRTHGCTREVCSFRDDYAALRAEGAEVLGVSRDTAESHADFAGRHRLPFALAADPRTRILDAYGTRAWYGWSRRVTYLIDPDGRIAKVYPRVHPSGHAAEVLEDLRALKPKSNTRVLNSTTVG